MKVIIYSALPGMMKALLCFVLKEIPLRQGQEHVKKRGKSFTTVFRHLGQNLPRNFQLELLQKSGSKDIGGFVPCSLTSHAAVNPQQQEVIFRLRSLKRPPGSTLPFPQLLQRRGLLASGCLHQSTMGSWLLQMN